PECHTIAALALGLADGGPQPPLYVRGLLLARRRRACRRSRRHLCASFGFHVRLAEQTAQATNHQSPIAPRRDQPYHSLARARLGGKNTRRQGRPAERPP